MSSHFLSRVFIRLIPLLVSGLLGGAVVASEVDKVPSTSQSSEAVAVFAAGCFWCVEPPFDKLTGVTSTISGYMGGHTSNPTYESISSGNTGHAEVVKVTYDPAQVSYETLLEVFWKNTDPTVKDQQFCDRGSQYRSAIFPQTDSQKALAEESLKALEQSGRFEQVYTTIEVADTFYPAEDYHQDYYIKNPVRYKYYRWGCGRDKRLEEVWGG